MKKSITILALALCIILSMFLLSCASGNVTVEFYADGKFVTSFSVEKGGSLDEIPEVPLKEGKVGKWDVKNFDEINQSIKVNAIYTNATYTIKFIVDDEEFTSVHISVNSHLTVVPDVPKKIGYIGEWSIADFTSINKDFVVYAVYTVVDSSVRFMVDGESTFVRYVSTGNALKDIPKVPLPIGKNYTGKWVNKDGTDADFSNIAGEITVYAAYYIDITLLGGENGNRATSDVGENIGSPDAGRKLGYDFLGWYTDEDLTDKVTFPTVFEGNITLYARWVSNEATTGFTFANGAVTGYVGEDISPIVPYHYIEDGESILITQIADNAFSNQQITTVTLPSTVQRIGMGAFQNCVALTDIYFPDGNYIEEIGNSAFASCTALTQYEFSQFTTNIGDGAFQDCTSVTTYRNLDLCTLERVGNNAFSGNIGVREFHFNGVKSIGEYAFDGNSNARFIFAKEDATERVGVGAFRNCVLLSKYVAPNAVEIGVGAFEGCYSLTSVTVISTTPVFQLFGLVDSDTDTNRFYTVDFDSAQYAVPLSLRGVLVRGNRALSGISQGIVVEKAFYNLYTVKSVELLNVEVIDKKAFLVDNGKLSDEAFRIVFNDGLESIEEQAFSGRKDLRELALPLTLVEIGDYAFNGSKSLDTVTIAANNALVRVGKFAFNDTAFFDSAINVVKVGRVAVGISDQYIQSVGKNALIAEDFSGIDTIAPYAFYGNIHILTVDIPSNVLVVSEFAFANCKSLKDVRISVQTKCGDSVLNGCASLKSLTLGLSADISSLFGNAPYDGGASHTIHEIECYLPTSWKALTLLADEVKIVVADGYRGYRYLEEIVLGEGIISVEDGALSQNPSLLKVTFPSTLQSLGTKPQEPPTEVEDNTSESQSVEVKGVFDGSSALNEVLFAQNGVLTFIGANVFRNTALNSIIVPATVTEIGDNAFRKTRLNSLSFENGNQPLTIGKFAFSESGAFLSANIVLPARLMQLGEYAFYNSKGIVAIELNEGVPSLGQYAFADCGIKKINLPASVQFYGENSEVLVRGLLRGNPLEMLTLYNGVLLTQLFDGVAPATLHLVTVNGGAVINNQFADMRALQTIILRDIVSVGDFAFYNCAGLKRIDLPSTVVAIGESAFSGCEGLLSFVFSDNSMLEFVGSSAYAGSINLSEVRFPDTVKNTDWTGMFDGCRSLTFTNIPTSVTVIGAKTFAENVSLKSIDIPSGVRSIGDYAFYNCTSMEFENIRFDELDSLGEYAFANCTLLKGVKADSIAAVGAHAFDGCTALREITVIDLRVLDYISDASKIITVNISQSADSVAENVFEGCADLVKVLLSSDSSKINAILTTLSNESLGNAKIFVNADVFASIDEPLLSGTLKDKIYKNPTDIHAIYAFDLSTKEAVLVHSDYAGEVLYLPSTVNDKEGNQYTLTEIGIEAFKDNQTIRELILPFTIQKIGAAAFQNTVIETVTIETGSHLTAIGDSAFYNCVALKGISLPDRLQTIGQAAFYGAIKLGYVRTTAYGLLKDIGERAFYRTSSLKEIVFNARIETIGKHAFDSSGLQSVTIDKNARIAKIDDYVFANCYQLNRENVVLPDGITVSDTAFDKE